MIIFDYLCWITYDSIPLQRKSSIRPRGKENHFIIRICCLSNYKFDQKLMNTFCFQKFNFIYSFCYCVSFNN